MSWDPDRLSERFLRRAEQEDRRIEECKTRIPRSTGHKRAHDEALAEYYVYNGLHGSTFLSSRETLLSGLHAMKAIDINIGTSAYDGELFERHRVGVITRLLAEFDVQD